MTRGRAVQRRQFAVRRARLSPTCGSCPVAFWSYLIRHSKTLKKMHTNAVVMHYRLDCGISGAFLFRNDNFLVRPPDLCRGISGLAEGTSSAERKSIFAAGSGKTDRTSFDLNPCPLDEISRVLRLTEVTSAFTDLLLRSVVGRVEGDEMSSSATPASIFSTTSCSSISDSLCVVISRRDS